jgi:hypothetical protein
VHAQALVDFWLETFKLQVEARSTVPALDTIGELLRSVVLDLVIPQRLPLEPPSKRRRKSSAPHRNDVDHELTESGPHWVEMDRDVCMAMEGTSQFYCHDFRNT